MKTSVKKSPIEALVAAESPKAAKRKSKDGSPLQLKRSLNSNAVSKNSPCSKSTPSPIAVKKSATASPIAVKRKPNLIANLPSSLKVTPVASIRSSPRKKAPVEEITLE